MPTPSANEPGFTVQPVDKNGNPTDNPNERWYHPTTGRLLQKGVQQAILPTVLANSPMRTSRRAMTTKEGGQAHVSLNQAIEVAQGILPREFESWDEVPASIRPNLLPTPNTMEHLPAREGEARERQLRRGDGNSVRSASGNLREDILTLLPGSESGDLDKEISIESDLLPTPMTTDRKGTGPKDKKQLRATHLLFPTPTTIDPRQGDNEASFNRKTPALGAVVHTLPTPVASEGIKASAAQSSKRRAETGQVFLTNIIHDIAIENELLVPTGNLLPTTRASMAKGSTVKERKLGNPKNRIETVPEFTHTNWGKFEPAIRRWEQVLGRPAPAPTKPDGKDGAHRLSSEFTEWMMGLPAGWITDVGLSRNDELKACGNGVVPQQAELALRMLFNAVGSVGSVGSQGGANLPTPTASDVFTGNLASTQQKADSMHSVTLPQIAERLASGKIETAGINIDSR